MHTQLHGLVGQKMAPVDDSVICLAFIITMMKHQVSTRDQQLQGSSLRAWGKRKRKKEKGRGLTSLIVCNRLRNEIKVRN